MQCITYPRLYSQSYAISVVSYPGFAVAKQWTTVPLNAEIEAVPWPDTTKIPICLPEDVLQRAISERADDFVVAILRWIKNAIREDPANYTHLDFLAPCLPELAINEGYQGATHDLLDALSFVQVSSGTYDRLYISAGPTTMYQESRG